MHMVHITKILGEKARKKHDCTAWWIMFNIVIAMVYSYSTHIGGRQFYWSKAEGQLKPINIKLLTQIAITYFNHSNITDLSNHCDVKLNLHFVINDGNKLADKDNTFQFVYTLLDKVNDFGLVITGSNIKVIWSP